MEENQKAITIKILTTVALIGTLTLLGILYAWSCYRDMPGSPDGASLIAFALVVGLGIKFIWFSEFADTAITKANGWYAELDGKRMKKYGTRIVVALFIIAGIVFIYNRDTSEYSSKKTAGYVPPVIDTVVKEYIVTHTYGRDTLRTELSIYKHRDSIAPGGLTISKVSVEENKKRSKRHKPFWKFWEKSDDEPEQGLIDNNQSAAKQESAASSDPNSSKAKIIITKEENGKETAKATVEITAPKSESSFGTQTSGPTKPLQVNPAMASYVTGGIKSQPKTPNDATPNSAFASTDH